MEKISVNLKSQERPNNCTRLDNFKNIKQTRIMRKRTSSGKKKKKKVACLSFTIIFWFTSVGWLSEPSYFIRQKKKPKFYIVSNSFTFGEKKNKNTTHDVKNNISTMNFGGMEIILQGCFNATGTGELTRIKRKMDSLIHLSVLWEKKSFTLCHEAKTWQAIHLSTIERPETSSENQRAMV